MANASIFSPGMPVFTGHAEFKCRLAALMKLLAIRLVKLLANPLSHQRTVAKWLVIGRPKALHSQSAKQQVASRWLTATESLVMLLGVVLLFFTALVVTSPAWAEGEVTIAVIYPDIGEPYREIFAKIIEGIEDKVGSRVANYPLRSDTDIGVLKASLLRQNTKVVLALGRQGMKTAKALNNDIR